MNKMLDVSILKDDDLKYNDDIAYIEGDDIYAETKDISPITYSSEQDYRNFVVNKLGTSEYSPELELDTCPLSVNNQQDCQSISESAYFEIKKDFLNQFKNVIINENDEITEQNFNKLKDYFYDGMIYYAITDTLVIPQTIYHYLNDETTINVKITVYNYAKRIKDYEIFKNFGKTVQNTLHFEYIPEICTFSKLKETKFGIFKALEDKYFDYNYLYINLPKEFYTNHIVDNKFLIYNTEESIYYGHSCANQTKLNVLAKDVAKNGLKKVIQFKLLKDGSLLPLFSNKRLLIAKYLGLPSIPACIISEPFASYDFSYYIKPEVNKEKLNEFLKPYFMIP